jgi:hypothetical protein
MEILNLRKSSLKKEILLFGILCIILFAVILYWAFKGNTRLRISGAVIDEKTSSILLYLIAISSLLKGVNLMIKLVSLFKYSQFVISISKDEITYPAYKSFKGYMPKIIRKNEISKANLTGKYNSEITLKDLSGKYIGTIDADLYDIKKFRGQELLSKINTWLAS